jgi:hypothetical protein
MIEDFDDNHSALIYGILLVMAAPTEEQAKSVGALVNLLEETMSPVDVELCHIEAVAQWEMGQAEGEVYVWDNESLNDWTVE